MPEPTKVCPNCPENGRQPWSAFGVRERWPDGSTRNVSGWCRVCMRQACRDWASRNPEMDRRRNDPEFAARRRAQQRDYRRRVDGITPDRYRTLRTIGPATRSRPIDAGPFRSWLLSNEPFFADRKAMADGLGIGFDLIGKVVNGQRKRVALDTVDRALTNYGAMTVDDLYAAA